MANTTDITTIETKALGDRSYVIIDNEHGLAAVIDPQRDIDRIEAVLCETGARITHVFETHIHNDYVTGGLELARRTGAMYVLSAEDDVSYANERTGACDGDEFRFGNLVMRAVSTPGHTPHHLSYVLFDSGEPVAAFTGGSMLYGTVGRTDLINAESTETLSREQYRSVRRLAELPGNVEVHPTHGFGSFCASTASSGSTESTIAEERTTNAALTTDEDSFVARLLSGLTAYPRYYAHMGAINRGGPAPVDLSRPEPVDPAEIRRRIHAGEWVVDLRSRTAFAEGHLVGTVNIEVGDSFATYLGWTIQWGTPVTLVGDTTAEVEEAQRQMVRIGIDRPAGGAEGGPIVWAAGGVVRSYRSASFADLANERSKRDSVVLDVRRDDEWADGRIVGALHIPLDELEKRVDEVPDGDVWVHCASGYRAAIAASLMDRSGRRVVAINDEWCAAAKSGLSITSCD